MTKPTSSTLRPHHMQQAIANARIEGFEPTKEFLADAKAIGQGTLSFDAAVQRSIDRARGLDVGEPGERQARLEPPAARARGRGERD